MYVCVYIYVHIEMCFATKNVNKLNTGIYALRICLEREREIDKLTDRRIDRYINR